MGESGPHGRAFVRTMPLNGFFPGKLLCKERNWRWASFGSFRSSIEICFSIMAALVASEVVKNGFSEIINWPFAMLKRATRPCPFPSTGFISYSGKFSSRIGSVPSTNCAMVVGTSGSSNYLFISQRAVVNHNLFNGAYLPARRT